jgi:hypothetical protein
LGCTPTSGAAQRFQSNLKVAFGGQGEDALGHVAFLGD